MKNIKNFISLNVEEKSKFIEEYGIFLMDRKSGNRRIFLYSFKNMFCEIWNLELLDHNEKLVTDLKLFKSREYLEPYLTDINIDQLFL
ncbi:MAG: hypothetical protein M3512_07255 [Bacteroidota bacterium]|nr:hypothetical protein [Bacteroidota bacterium]